MISKNPFGLSLFNTKPALPPPSPFCAAKQEWDDRMGSLVIQAKNWRITAALSLIVALAFGTLCIIQAYQRQVIPIIVGVHRETGEPVVVGPAPEQYRPSESEIRYFLSEFVRLIRAVHMDEVLIRLNWQRAYKYLSRQAASYLDDITQKDPNSPIKKLGELLVSVQPLAVVQIPGTPSYQVRWQETIYSSQGFKLDEYTMLGIFTIEFVAPKDQEMLMANPLGIVIKSFTWNKELNK